MHQPVLLILAIRKHESKPWGSKLRPSSGDALPPSRTKRKPETQHTRAAAGSAASKGHPHLPALQQRAEGLQVPRKSHHAKNSLAVTAGSFHLPAFLSLRHSSTLLVIG